MEYLLANSLTSAMVKPILFLSSLDTFSCFSAKIKQKIRTAKRFGLNFRFSYNSANCIRYRP